MLAKTPKPKDKTTLSHLVQISPQLLLFYLAKSSELSACVPEKPGYDGCLVCAVSVQCLDFGPPSRRLRDHLHYQNFPWNWFSVKSVSSFSRCYNPYHFHIIWEVTQPELPMAHSNRCTVFPWKCHQLWGAGLGRCDNYFPPVLGTKTR